MNLNEKNIEELQEIFNSISAEIKKRKREIRRRNGSDYSERELKVFEEYEKLRAAGEDVEPIVEKVDLEALVGSDVYERILEVSNENAVVAVEVRGVPLDLYAPNLRSLWQSFGQEHIEPDLLDFIDSCDENSVYFDLGASTGVFALYAAAKGIRTYCFEPEAANFNILNMNAFLNFKNINKGYINCFNIAAADVEKTDSMYIRKFEASAHEKILGAPRTRAPEIEFDYEYVQRVYCISLDDFCEREKIYPTDIKIDVDGAELAVIAGMRKLLGSGRIKRVFIEISKKDPNSLKALDQLLGAGFEIKSRKRVQNYFGEHNFLLERK